MRDMTLRRTIRTAVRLCTAAVAAGIGCYAAYVATTWLRYGHRRSSSAGDEAETLLDAFMPFYEVVERHQTAVAAPAEITLAAACDMELETSTVATAIFKGRELLLGGTPEHGQRPRGLLALARSLGWEVLAETPGREIVIGAVTRPWQADVVFRPIASAQFAAFSEPDYVKIAWTLSVEPVSDQVSLFRTETRAVPTDPSARRKFRRYWAFLSPGIILIRRAALGLLRTDAEQRARAARVQPRVVG
jgi:hypothetical protein